MRGFSDEEREQLETGLLEAGEELLLTYGPKKTTIADITDAVGIATSTFYLFFDSKDALYLEIIQREIQAFQESLDELIEDAENSSSGLERLFQEYLTFAKENPLIQEVIIQDNYGEVFQSTIPDRLETLKRERMGNFLGYIEDLQAMDDGRFAQMPSMHVLAIMSVLGLFALHREEYETMGEGFGDITEQVLVDTLIRGLTGA